MSTVRNENLSDINCQVKYLWVEIYKSGFKKAALNFLRAAAKSN